MKKQSLEIDRLIDQEEDSTGFKVFVRVRPVSQKEKKEHPGKTIGI